MDEVAIVRYRNPTVGDEQDVRVASADTIRFGRSDRPAIGTGDGVHGVALPEDRAVSRVAGRIRFDSSAWVVENASKTRPLSIELPDEIRHVALSPGGRSELRDHSRVLVIGAIATYPIDVEVPPRRLADSSARADGSTRTTDLDEGPPSDFKLEGLAKLACVHLARGYFARWPSHHPEPLSHARAAELAGTTERRIAKHVEGLVLALTDRHRVPAFVDRRPRTPTTPLLIDWLVDQRILVLGDAAMLAERWPPERALPTE